MRGLLRSKGHDGIDTGGAPRRQPHGDQRHTAEEGGNTDEYQGVASWDTTRSSAPLRGSSESGASTTSTHVGTTDSPLTSMWVVHLADLGAC
jgi:hypothetical protein